MSNQSSERDDLVAQARKYDIDTIGRSDDEIRQKIARRLDRVGIRTVAFGITKEDMDHAGHRSDYD